MNTPIIIDKARWWALTTPHVAFYGALAGNLPDVISPSCKTACTDGTRITWNPDYLAKLTEEEVRFVLLHETLHCAHGHFWRLPINAKGNQAGDYAINRTLESIPGIKMPEGGLLDHAYDGLCEEEILARLPEPPPGGKGGKPGKPDPTGQGGNPGDQEGEGEPEDGEGDPGGCGGFEAPQPTVDGKGKPKPAPTTEELKERWERNIVQADQVARSLGQGNAPADMQRVLDRIKAPGQVDWRQATADFARTALSARNDWSRGPRSRPNMDRSPVYPRRRQNDVGTIICVRDTSGSISNEIAAAFTGHIAEVMAELNCSALVMDCDTVIAGEYRLDHGDLPPLDAKGGGGTDFRPPFARARELIEQGEAIAGIIYLTDLCGDEPDEVDVPVPVLWLSTDPKATAKTGITVPIEV